MDRLPSDSSARIATPTSSVGRTTRRLLGVVAVTLAVAAACVPAADDTANVGSPSRAPEAVRAPGGGAAPAGSFISADSRLGIGDCPIYPTNNVFHADVSRLPVTPDSAATIAAAGATLPLVPGVHSAVYQGSRGGIPVNVVDSRSTPLSNVRGGLYAFMSDLLDHPIPASPRLEGYPSIAWDRHMLLYDVANCTSHEFFYVSPPNFLFNMWSADSAVTLDMTSNTIRPGGTTTASGTSMLAGMIRYDEVASGRIDHMMSISLPTISNQPPLWPASHTDGRSTDPNAPRMGAVVRLRADADLSGLGPDATTIARALQQHGAFVGDTAGAKIGLAGENDGRWRDADVNGLGRFALRDFEFVDASVMQVSPTSYEIR